MEPLQLTQTSQYSKLWYVVFSPTDGGIPWYQKAVLKTQPKEFGHVALISPCTEHHALVIEPQSSGIEIELREFPHKISSEAARLAQLTPVLAYIAEPLTARHITNLIPSCVSVAKAVMGVPCPAVTPQGLYRWLLVNGASRL